MVPHYRYLSYIYYQSYMTLSLALTCSNYSLRHNNQIFRHILPLVGISRLKQLKGIREEKCFLPMCITIFAVCFCFVCVLQHHVQKFCSSNLKRKKKTNLTNRKREKAAMAHSQSWTQKVRISIETEQIFSPPPSPLAAVPCG